MYVISAKLRGQKDKLQNLLQISNTKCMESWQASYLDAQTIINKNTNKMISIQPDIGLEELSKMWCYKIGVNKILV